MNKEKELNERMNVDMTWNEYFKILEDKRQEGKAQTIAEFQNKLYVLKDFISAPSFLNTLTQEEIIVILESINEIFKEELLFSLDNLGVEE